MASNITDLKLGISQSELIQNTKTHIDTLYDQNSAQATDITKAQKTADDAYLLASQKHKIVAYDTLSAMITALNSANKDEFNIGDEIYIKDTAYTRDFWVSGKQDTPYTNQTDKNGFKADKFDKGYVGYFELSILDERPEVTNMVTSDENITDGNIVLGAGNKKVKGSSVKITDLATTANLGNAIASTKTDILNTVAGSYATKDELANAGKVKSVSINGGTKNEPDLNGNIDLDLSDIGGAALGTDIKQATLINYPSDSDPQYKAIQMDKNSVVIEVLKKENDEYSSVVTQSIVVGEFTYYLLDKSATTGDYWYREVGGNVVGGGGSTSQLENRVGILETNVEALEAKSNLYFYKVKLTGTAYAEDESDDGTAILYLSFYSKTKNTSFPESFKSFNSDAKIQLWTNINSYLLRGYVVVDGYHMPILDASTSYSSNIIAVNVITPADGTTIPYNIQAISIDSYLFTTVQ